MSQKCQFRTLLRRSSGDRVEDETCRTVDLDHSSDGPSWIDLIEIRFDARESRLDRCLNRLLQQNLPNPDIDLQTVRKLKNKKPPKGGFSIQS
jgi:hypothetical protein